MTFSNTPQPSVVGYLHLLTILPINNLMKLALLAFLCLLLGGAFKLSSRETKEIKQSGLIRVVGSSESLTQNEEKCCFSIEIEDKNKRKGYERMKRKFTLSKNYLVTRGILPEGHAFKSIKEEVRMNHNRKVWVFKRLICFLTEQDKESFIEKVLRRLKIKHVSFRSVGELNQYDMLMKAFNDAKKKAKEYLETIEYRIKRVVSVSILNPDLDLESNYDTWLSSFHQGNVHDNEDSTNSEEVKTSTSMNQQSRDRSEDEYIHVEAEVLFSIESLDDFKDDDSSSQEEARSQKHHDGNDDSDEDSDDSSDL